MFKGFVPVSAEALNTMATNYINVARDQALKELQRTVDTLVVNEEYRATKRRWWGLVAPHQPRFASVPSVVEGVSLDDFEPLFKLFSAPLYVSETPFHQVFQQYQRRLDTAKQLMQLAESKNAGEPVYIDAEKFVTFDKPEEWCLVDVKFSDWYWK